MNAIKTLVRLSLLVFSLFGALTTQGQDLAADKASGQVVCAATSRHIHILKRQDDGSWKTWRMMSNSAQPLPAP